MAEIIFKYNGKDITILCDENGNLKNICTDFSRKVNIDINSVFFIYSGNKINENLTFNEQANTIDRERKKMIFLVNENAKELAEDSNIIEVKQVLCPKCGEISRIKIEDYKITLFDCINKHKINNILLSEFSCTSNVDLSKIKCEKCKINNKGNAYKNLFYKCLNCKMNLCPLCKSSHDKSHNIIDYDDKNYICSIHNELFNSYCNNCKKNICLLCENEHHNHKIIYYSKIMAEKEYKLNELKNLRKSIDNIKEEIKIIEDELNLFIKNIDILYNINKSIINNYDIKKRNYQTLTSLDDLNINYFIYEISKIINNQNKGYKINKIFEIYEKMINKKINYINELKNKNEFKNTKIKENKENNEIAIEYQIKNEKIKLFGSSFVKNNKDKCLIKYKEKEYDLLKYFDSNLAKDRTLIIKLIGVNNITDMSCMFKGCSNLIGLPDISQFKTTKITDMSYAFSDCINSHVNYPIFQIGILVM